MVVLSLLLKHRVIVDPWDRMDKGVDVGIGAAS